MTKIEKEWQEVKRRDRVIKFTIPIQPITKKNHQRIMVNRKTGRRFISPSAQYKRYERDCAVFMPKLLKPIDYPVNVKCIFFMDTRRRCDLVNHLESIDDILVKYGVLADDNYKIVQSHDGSQVEYGGKNMGRTEVEITPIK